MKALWDARFAGDEYVYGTAPNRFFAAQIVQTEPGRLLLPGEGEGRNAVFAALKGWQVDAIDFSHEARKKALALAEQSGTKLQNYLVCDLAEATLPENSYDAAAEIFVHLPPELRKQWHRKLSGSIRPGGRLIIEAYHRDQLSYGTGGPQHPDLLYTAHLLASDFPDFEMLMLDETVDTLNEGLLHQGLSALVRLVAVKR
ncbi:MAG: class I SAM-dependent methyltransferase [Bacteroidetes bacterium]|nr:class I SAM-dependent methyltransferase [Bacteroidota bacterium]